MTSSGAPTPPDRVVTISIPPVPPGPQRDELEDAARAVKATIERLDPTVTVVILRRLWRLPSDGHGYDAPT